MDDKNRKFFYPVSKCIKINASSQRVWQVISKPGNLEYYHPFCESNPSEKWPGADSIDYVNYYNGLKFQRKFINWIEGSGYDLMIGRKNGRKSKVIWRIKKIDNSKSQLKITIYPHDTSRYPNIIRILIYFFYVQPMLIKYLSSVLRGIRWYILQGKAVQKNQLGKHKWFSN